MPVNRDIGTAGNSEKDWEIFDILCREIDQPCGVGVTDHHIGHSVDLVTTLRSELAASTYKRDRLLSELADSRNFLCAKESECETLRSQTVRQSALVASLQARIQAIETRERNLQSRTENVTTTLQREKRCLEEKNKEICARIRRLECELQSEESQKDQARTQLHDLVRRLAVCLGIDSCENSHLSPETVLTKTGDTVTELQCLRSKLATTTESLHNTESELVNSRATLCAEKQRLQQQIESLQSISGDLETRLRQSERDLQITRDRLIECESTGDKLRDEIRGFESRCGRLENSLDRIQNDRAQYLRGIANLIQVTEPCETLVKEKIRELVNENQSLQTQITNLRDQISTEAARHRETIETTNCRLRAEESQKCSVEDRLEKVCQELQFMKSEHLTLSEYLVRLARSLNWSECTEPPAHGSDTTILAETLLERAERLAVHHDSHLQHNHDHHHHHNSLKLRRERSCHEMSTKETTAVYNLQRRVRVLREQLSRRDLHLELLRRKMALMEETVRGRCVVQSERDEAINRARRSAKQSERTAQQLIEAKAQLNEMKSQLVDAADYKITALERGRKIDELQAKIVDMETDKGRLMTQLASYKSRTRSAVECSNDRSRRDEQVINTLRDDLTRMKGQLSDANHKLSQLQAFRTSVARLLHLRDIPHSGILQRLQTLCNAHQEFTLLSRRYESASPIGEHPCPRYDDLVPPTPHCRPLSSSPGNIRRNYEDSGLDEHYDDDFDFCKKL